MITYPVIRLQTSQGVIQFSEDEVHEAECVQEIHPLSLELPISTLEYSIRNVNQQFSPFDEGVLLERRLPQLAYEQVGETLELVGRFFLDEWRNRNENMVWFRAVDYIGLLEEFNFDGIFWDQPITLNSALQQILGPINVPYSVSSEIANSPISGWIAPGSYRSALRQVCFAARAMALTAGRQNIRIEPIRIPESTFDLFVPNTQRVDDTEVELALQITGVELLSHNYTQGTEEVVVFEEVLPPGQHKIVFQEPFFNIVIDGPGFVSVVLGFEDGEYFATEDDAFLEVAGEYVQGVNSVTLTITEEANVKITGTRWVNSQQAHVFREPDVPNERPLSSIDRATLVNANRAPNVLNNVVEYYRRRHIQDMTILPGTARPGDVIASGTQFGKYIVGIVKRRVLRMSGGYLMNVSLRGKELPTVPPLDEPYRRPRCGVAVCGADMTRQNMFREYA